MRYVYDYSKLKGKIIEKFSTQSNFAAAIGKDNAYVSQYLNNKRKFCTDEMIRWAEVLDIQEELYNEYFFKYFVDK